MTLPDLLARDDEPLPLRPAVPAWYTPEAKAVLADNLRWPKNGIRHDGLKDF
jgi:hypothetical protein